MKYATKAALLEDIAGAYDALEQRVDDVPESRRDEPGVWGEDWTVTDLIAHLAEWHRMLLRWYREGAAGRRPDMPAPGYTWNQTPQLNRDIQARHAGRPWAEVWAEFQGTHARVVDLVESLGESELLETGHFAWTRKSSLSTYIGPNTASHYRFAVRVLKRWLKSAGAS
jgi:hypothetical protein